MRKYHCLIAAAAMMTIACGGESPTSPTSIPNGGNTHDTVFAQDGIRFGVRNSDPCGDVTYVGPIRLPISVHGSTANISWLGADGATRGYEVQFERLDVTNVWLFADSTVVNPPEIERHFRTEGTYRVRVRGLFCNDQIGPWTDWQIFSTDDTENHDVPPPHICLTSVDGCYPPPPQCLVECPPPPCTHDCDEGDHDNGHGNDGDHHDDDNPGNAGGDHGGPGNDDGPPPCNLHTTKNPHDGDHNDDGHNDCGHGHH